MKRTLQICHFAIGLALVVVLLGGWTRITDAGLGCPDWPGCYGEMVLPFGEEQLQQAQQRFPEQPLVSSKGWMEMVHRYAAGTLGVVILALAVMGWKQRRQPNYPLTLSLGLLVLVVVQGAFGMWTVTLKLLPQVVTVHLLGGLLTLTLLLGLRYRLLALMGPGVQTEQTPQRRWLVMLGAGLLFGQITLGGWTSANYAGWACTDWLLCDREHSVEYDFDAGFALPAYDGQSHEGGEKSRDARAAIQMVHRGGAVVVSAYLLGLCLLWRRHEELLVPVATIALLVIAQNLLGMLNVVWALPRPLAIAHHGGAVALLVSLGWLYTRIGLTPEGVKHAK